MRKQPKRLPDMAQRSFGFEPDGVARAPEPVFAPGDDWFQPDRHRSLRVGEEPLEHYLQRMGLGWVVRLRTVLEGLDWQVLTRAYHPLGRKAKHPRVMLGLVVYGILSSRWTLRELELLAARDVGAWWICGGQTPDHSTIGEFLQRHQAVLTREFFVSLVQHLVARLRLQPGTAALDGTVIEAAASRFGLLTLEAAQQAAARAQQRAHERPTDAAAQAAAQAATTLAAVAAERAARRARKGRKPEQTVVARCDPAAVLQPRKDGAWRPAYRPSALVHESGLIVGQSVHASNEAAQVPSVLAQHTQIFGRLPLTLLADGNYHEVEVLAAAVAHDIDLLCPAGAAQGEPGEKRGAKGRFSKSRFVYEVERDVYRCPAGQALTYRGRGTDGDGREYRHYSTPACRQCALRAQCTTATQGRRIARYAGDEYKEAMRTVFEQPAARQAYRQRWSLGERVYAELCERQRLRRFHRHGLAGVGLEFALHCIAFDLKLAVHHAAAYVIVAFWRHPGENWQRLGLVAVIHVG